MLGCYVKRKYDDKILYLVSLRKGELMCFTGGGTGNVLVVISSGDKLSRKTIIKKSRYVLFCVLFCFYKMMERLKKMRELCLCSFIVLLFLPF